MHLTSSALPEEELQTIPNTNATICLYMSYLYLIEKLQTKY